MFDFDSTVDIVVTSDSLLISSETAFEVLFKEDEFLVQHIPVWVDAIADHLPVSGDSRGLLIERCRRDTRLRRRLEAIHSRGHLKSVTIEQICDEADRQGVDTATLVAGGQLHIEATSVGELLRLLNEDLFIGGLSGERFAAERKAIR